MNDLGKHKAVIILCAIALAFVIGGFAWALSALAGQGNGPFILHFNDIEGITQTGPAGDLAFAGIFAAVAVVMNALIGIELDRRSPVLGKLMASVTLAGAVLLFIACAAILKVN